MRSAAALRANAARIARSTAEAAVAAVRGAGSPIRAGARGSRAPSTAPIYPAPPAETGDKAPVRRATKPGTTSDLGEREAIEPAVGTAVKTRTEFLNPAGSETAPVAHRTRGRPPLGEDISPRWRKRRLLDAPYERPSAIAPINSPSGVSPLSSQNMIPPNPCWRA
jgi:hypothetical protein